MKFNRLLPLLAGSLTLLGMASILPARASVFEYRGPNANFTEVRQNEAPTRPDNMGADRDELDSNDASTMQLNNTQNRSNVIQRVGDASVDPSMYNLNEQKASYDNLLPPDDMGFDRDELDANDLRMNLIQYTPYQANSRNSVIQRQGTVNSMPGMTNNTPMYNQNNMGQPNSVSQPDSYTQPDRMGGERDELDRNDATTGVQRNNTQPSSDVIRRQGTVNNTPSMNNNMGQPNSVNQSDSYTQPDRMGGERDELDRNDTSTGVQRNNTQPSSDVIRREGTVNQGSNVFDYNLNNLSQPDNVYQPANGNQMNNMNDRQQRNMLNDSSNPTPDGRQNTNQ